MIPAGGRMKPTPKERRRPDAFDTAKQLGLEVPAGMAARADDVLARTAIGRKRLPATKAVHQNLFD